MFCLTPARGRRGRIEPSGTRRFSTPYTLSLLTRPFQAQLSSDQRGEHPLRRMQRQSPVLKALRNYSVACLGSPRGQCDVHSFAQTFWFETLSAILNHVSTEAFNYRAVDRAFIRAEIRSLSLVPNRGRYRSRHDHDYIDAVDHHFRAGAPQTYLPVHVLTQHMLP
jgi:hypothetical protein